MIAAEPVLVASMIFRFNLGLTLASMCAAAALAQEPGAQRGRIFAQNNCSSCHSIDRISASPLAIAPPFRDLHKRYPIEDLAEAFAEGITTGHPTMPEFRLDPGQIGDLLSFMKSLER